MNALQAEQLYIVADQVRSINQGALWIASYGSLPGRPEPGMGIMSAAYIEDYTKDLCVRVRTCRGTEYAPGLVAGVLPAIGDRAMAMISTAHIDALPTLCQRELDGKAYDARLVLVERLSGERHSALTFAAAVTHPDCVAMTVSRAATTVAAASGSCGTNRNYLEQVLAFERETFGRTTPRLGQIDAALTMQFAYDRDTRVDPA